MKIWVVACFMSTLVVFFVDLYQKMKSIEEKLKSVQARERDEDYDHYYDDDAEENYY